ncbi:MAG TPA: hypothetical protein PKN75_09530 [Bacteroidia bacterium]|nr:hypothetical protein [Bacteroidia bacterium]HNU33821.1 hypothetical protein [Bacteroidia bacterium]
MLHDNNSFDDSVRRKLQEDEEPVSGALWENIAKEIPANSSNKRKIAYYLIAALLLISGSGYYFINDENKTEIAAVKVKSNLEVQSPSDKDLSETTLNVANNEADKSEEKSNESNAVAEPVVVSVNLSKPHTKNEQTKKGNIKKSDVSTTLEEPVLISDNSTVDIKEDATNGTELKNVEATGNENTDTIQITDSASVLANQEPIQQAAAQAAPVVNDSAIIAGGLKNNVGIEVSFSPDFIFKKWIVNYGTQEYLDTRRETESFLFAHTYGAKIYFKVAKGVFLKTGIYLTEVTELLHYSYLQVEPNDLFTKLGGYNGTWFNPLTNQITGDTSVANFVYPDDIVSTNNYKYFNIPLQLAAYKELKRFRVGVSAGVTMNYSFKQKGSIMKDDKYGKIILSDKNRSPYKSTIGLGITTSTFASYKIRRNINFFLEPEYRVYLQPISKSDAPLTEKLSSLSIMSGLQFEF